MNVKLATLAAPEASARTRTAVTHALARPVSPVTPKWHALTSTSAHRRHPASRRLPFAEEAPSATICPDLLNASARLDSRATLKLPVKVLEHFSFVLSHRLFPLNNSNDGDHHHALKRCAMI